MAASEPTADSSAIRLCRVSFKDAAPAGAEVLREFTDPYRRFAVVETMPLDDLPGPASTPEPQDEFHFLFLPGGSAESFDWQKKAEQWMTRPPAADAAPTVEILLRSDRVLWRPGRSLMIGAPERMTETLLALTDFSFYEGELRRLEEAIEADLDTAMRDAPLTTAAVTPRSLDALAHVSELATRMTLLRIRYARLERPLEKASVTLPGSGRRLVGELLMQTELADRLKAVDHRLEVYSDLYELANDRLSEYRYFRKEAVIEAWIVVILVAEVLLMIWEIGLLYHFG